MVRQTKIAKSWLALLILRGNYTFEQIITEIIMIIFILHVFSVHIMIEFSGRGRGRDSIVWLLDLQLPTQSVPIATNVVSSNPAHSEAYSIQHYVIKFFSDLRQVGGFLQVPWFPHQ